MDAVHLHLISNHVPSIGAFFGALVLLYALMKKSSATIYAAYWVFLVAAVVGLVAYFSGEGAEEAVEHLPGVSENIIEAHENVAKFTLAAFVVLAVLSLVGLLRSIRDFDRLKPWARIVLIVAFLSLGVAVYTSFLGGQIRHTELRTAAPEATPGQQEQSE